MPFYAVHEGRETGVYRTWREAQRQVEGYEGAVFKKFESRVAAETFARTGKVNGRKATPSPSTRPGATTVWCDGACSCNGAETAIAGIGVYFGEGDPRNVSERLMSEDGGKVTNQQAEMAAVIRALQIVEAEGKTLVNVFTDSMFVQKCAVQYMPAWRKNGFRKADGKPVANEHLVRRLADLLGRLDVCVYWVRGHDGDPGNEAADRLATAGCAR